MTAPAEVEEVVEDEDGFHDPMLRAIEMLLKANAILKYLDSFTLEQRLIVHDFMNSCWLAVTDETRDAFKSSSPLAKVEQDSSSSALALRLLVVAKTTQPHIASLSPDRKELICGFLATLLKMNTEFLNNKFSDLDELLAVLLIIEDSAPVVSLLGSPDVSKCSLRLSDIRVNVVNSIRSPSEQEGTWKHVKSRRQQKSASKNSNGFAGKVSA